MERESVMTSNKRVNLLRGRLRNPAMHHSCIAELRDILEAEAAQLFRAEAS